MLIKDESSIRADESSFFVLRNVEKNESLIKHLMRDRRPPFLILIKLVLKEESCKLIFSKIVNDQTDFM